jgi:hypothetical protein
MVFLLSSSSLARTAKNRVGAADSSYSAALAAANRFLHAWQTQDHETGITMLADAARQHASREKLQEFFSPAREAAFEIQHGKRMNRGEYSFPVVLFGLSEATSRPHVCRIVITRLGKDEWVVDRLP